jgi:hypothetical protein
MTTETTEDPTEIIRKAIAEDGSYFAVFMKEPLWTLLLEVVPKVDAKGFFVSVQVGLPSDTAEGHYKILYSATFELESIDIDAVLWFVVGQLVERAHTAMRLVEKTYIHVQSA